MAFSFRKGNDDAPETETETESPGREGGWYPDPYGIAARRWYEHTTGWSKRVQGEGDAPDKTGLARMDEAAVASDDSTRPEDGDGKPEPLSRPVDPKFKTDAGI